MNTPPDQATPRPWQFRLRTLLLVLTATAMIAAWWIDRSNLIRQVKQAEQAKLEVAQAAARATARAEVERVIAEREYLTLQAERDKLLERIKQLLGLLKTANE